MSSEVVREERPLRADARRNRERVMTAAREVFAEYGLEAQMDQIAAQAGVGVGTVYRHFPTKEALVAALVADRWSALAAAAEPFLKADDPWEGLTGFLWRCAELQRANRAWAELTADRPQVFAAEDERQKLLAVTQRLVDRARAAGAVRDDLAAQDIGMLMCGTCSVMRMNGGHDGDPSWKRFFELALSGLRA